ncbi:MAG: HD domain-containing protein [Candidatus Saccharimonadales bacterium]
MTNPNISPETIAARTEDLMLLSGIVYQFIDTKRATQRHNRPETDGEHTLHLQYLAVSYAAKYHPELAIGKVSLYCLVHDFVEVYAQDVNSLIASPEELAQKALREELAFRRLESELGQVWPQLINTVQSYELLSEPEARYVKCFDKCDPSFSHFSNRGTALRRMGVTSREVFDGHCEEVRLRMEPYAAEFPDVVAIRQELLQRVSAVTYSTV